jgi:hypothetical protein
MSPRLIVHKFVTVAHLIIRLSHTGRPFCLVLPYVTSAYKKCEQDLIPWLMVCIDETSAYPQIGPGTRRNSEVNNPKCLSTIQEKEGVSCT